MVADHHQLPARIALVAARNEADRIAGTIAALRAAMRGVTIVVADDASTDGTRHVALQHGARVIRGERSRGKGQNMTAAARTVLHRAYEPTPPTFLLCDGDLGDSAGALVALCEAVERQECELAVAVFARRVGGGVGAAVAFARWATGRLCGVRPRAPMSGQRALSAEAFRLVVPFADGYGMEVGIAADVVRAGLRLGEYELDLAHRATGRSPAGFVHRARQLRDMARAYASRRWSIG
ncbi:MAG: glycosyltransferase [Solirubrobacterales bacterium]